MNSKVRQEYTDYDYINQLSDDDKKFLDDFNKEYYNASVGKQSDEGKDNRFMKTKEDVKESQGANNRRQRDLYGLTRNKVGATKLISVEDARPLIEAKLEVKNGVNTAEDVMIEMMDNLLGNKEE